MRLRKAIRRQLAEAIESSGHTRLAVANAANIDPGNLSKYLNHGWGVNLDRINDVANVVGLEPKQ